jgi:ATP-binding cassette subfamily F protein 3
VGLVSQTAPSGSNSVLSAVLAADEEREALLVEIELLESDASDAAGMRLAEVHHRLDDIDAQSAPSRAGAILHGLGFSGEEQTQPLDSFSGGWRMRVALAAALFAEPDLLLLDEPTNHLDLEATLWLVQFLARWPHTLLVVSHDRALINRVADYTIHLEDKKLAAYRGGFDNFERTRREKLILDSANRKKMDARRKHMQAFVDRFRYQANKARQAQSRIKALEKLGEAPPPIADYSVEFHFPEPKPLAPPLLTLDQASAGYAPDSPVLESLNLRIDMDDRIVLLGANGNGKTTLLRVLEGAMAPLTGTRNVSRKLEIGYFAQEQIEMLDLDRTAFAHVADRLPDALPTAVRGHLGRFGLSGPLADQDAGSLSGGERVRLVLALICCRSPHLLLLDEPTNHLDLDAREALVDAINEFTGAVVLVTHDQELIERCADRLWLVANRTCRPFDDDLGAYRAQLLASRKSKSQRKPLVESTAPPTPPAPKAERRRNAAAQRVESAALRKAVRDAEKETARLGGEKDRLDAAIADPKLYDGPPERITELTKKRSEIAAALNAAEEKWLAAQEAMENPG